MPKRGYRLTETTKKRMSLAKLKNPTKYWLGKKRPDIGLLMKKIHTGRYGLKASRFKGEKAGYQAKHSWIRKHYGGARMCKNINCESEKPKRFEWARISKKVTRNIEDYIQLCPSCHRKMDLKIINIKN